MTHIGSSHFLALFFVQIMASFFWTLPFQSQDNYSLRDVRMLWTRSGLGGQCETHVEAVVLGTDVDMKLFISGSGSALEEAALQGSKLPP